MTYEGFYVQEAERKIESIINVDVPQLGINEITSKVIGSVIDNEKKIKKTNKTDKKIDMERWKVSVFASAGYCYACVPAHIQTASERRKETGTYFLSQRESWMLERRYYGRRWESVQEKQQCIPFRTVLVSDL